MDNDGPDGENQKEDLPSLIMLVYSAEPNPFHQGLPHGREEQDVDWKCKAFLQQALSCLPRGEQLNYICQRWVTKNLPMTEEEACRQISLFKQYADLFRLHSGKPLGEAVFYEFGVGWDLLGPIALWALGVERQIVIDIARLFHAELVNDALDRIPHLSLPFAFHRLPTRHVGKGAEAISHLREYYGIDYRAPVDARSTGLESSSVDCITSTGVLEHVPPGEIKDILTECSRILSGNGLMIHLIGYEDHYFYFDHNISCYNFLRYSDRTWPLFNSALHYQNRLRHRDYLAMFSMAGFQVVDEEREDGTTTDLETLQKIPLARRFAGYTPEELAVRNSRLALRKLVSQHGELRPSEAFPVALRSRVARSAG